MAITKIPAYTCPNCKRFKNWGKWNCKTCYRFYTDEFKTARLTYKQIRRIKKSESPTELVKMYDWLRENVFPEGYVNPSNKIVLRYTKNGSRTSRCYKNDKEIAITQIPTSKRMYDFKTKESYNKPLTPEELKTQEKYQWETMLHEMLHLRLPHHKKSFRNKEAELRKVLELKRSIIN
jgi:hypothetical protein